MIILPCITLYYQSHYLITKKGKEERKAERILCVFFAKNAFPFVALSEVLKLNGNWLERRRKTEENVLSWELANAHKHLY